jgi:hypothetical protein
LYRRISSGGEVSIKTSPQRERLPASATDKEVVATVIIAAK